MAVRPPRPPPAPTASCTTCMCPAPKFLTALHTADRTKEAIDADGLNAGRSDGQLQPSTPVKGQT